MSKHNARKKNGKVYLVGAGPGDPELITVKGLEYLKRAEVVIYDRLIDDSLLDAAPHNAERIYVGKGHGCHSRQQKEINLLLVAKAREGKTIVRLKGGDPFVLGRGGEEAEILAHNGIPFEVVPGVSSAYAVPAYAGIPVTDRRLASSFMVLTGHEDADKTESTIRWDKVSTGSDTLVILMGMGNLASIATELMSNGRPATTPAAVISQGTSPLQRTIAGTLGDIADRAREEGITAPAVIVVGEVVKLREHLRWFDNLPLFGKRILVTRPEEQARGLNQLLRERGALPVEMPVIKIIPPSTWKKLDRAIQEMKTYGWVVFTSVNAVEMFFRRLHSLRLDARWLCNVKIGAIGPATAKSLEEHGVCPDYIPQVYTSQGFVAGLDKKAIKGQGVLLPRADIVGNEMNDGLIKLGADVHQVAAYRTVAVEAESPGKEMLLKGKIDVITFTSASTVNNLVTVLGKDWQVMKKAKLACIGPNTAIALEQKGLKPDIVAKEHTMLGLVEAIEQYCRR
ncbi:MAG: uroporphyrinogen-III C-methyltransferase [Chloroflexi bacterium]|nr:uroporphyrinogen-III C-methyltransferase [Chloroflexota bacterium]MBM3172560.1 uroporphyrinogen-III C-methyltransferase [Chloroflexota bacterium]